MLLWDLPELQTVQTRHLFMWFRAARKWPRPHSAHSLGLEPSHSAFRYEPEKGTHKEDRWRKCVFTMTTGIRTGRRAAMDSFKSVWVWVGKRNGSKWCRLTCFTAITAFPSVTGVLVVCASPSIHPSPACQTSGLMELVSLDGGVFLILQLASGFTFFFCFWCWLLGWCSASDCALPPHWAFPGNGKPQWPFLGSASPPPLSLALSDAVCLMFRDLFPVWVWSSLRKTHGCFCWGTGSKKKTIGWTWHSWIYWIKNTMRHFLSPLHPFLLHMFHCFQWTSTASCRDVVGLKM